MTGEMASIKRILNNAWEKDIPAYVNLDQAVALKGFVSKQTIITRPWFQPCCGKHWMYLAGRKVWTREQILEWLAVTDETLEEYARKMDVDISPYFKDGKTIYRSKND